MEPLVPDWRTLGTGPLPAATSSAARGDASPRTVAITSRLLAWGAAAIIAAALAGGAAFLALMPTTSGVVMGAGEPGLLAISAPDLEPDLDLRRAVAPAVDLVVDVEGAVARPGLVHVPAGGRVGDAIVKAGGFAPNADLTRTAAELNLAQQVTDGLKVMVPAIGQGTTAMAGSERRPVGGGGPVDLNHASESELDSLPGVGPATIAKIVAARSESPFTSTNDLRTRDIVGDAAFQKLEGLVTVGR